MELSELQDKIMLKIQEVLDTSDTIAIDQDLFDLGLDSMKSISLIVNLEETFNIVFEDEELLFEYYSNIQKITDRIATKINQF